MCSFWVRLILVIFILSGYGAVAQSDFNADSVRVTRDQSFIEFVQYVENNSSYKFFYIYEWVKDLVVDKGQHGKSLQEIVSYVTGSAQLNCLNFYSYAFVIYKDPKQDKVRDELLSEAVSKRITVNKIIIGTKHKISKNEVAELAGIVRDEETKAPLADVLIRVGGEQLFVRTNRSGSFKISLPVGEHVLIFNIYDYEEKLIDLAIYENGQTIISLNELPVMLSEVVVSEQSIIDRRIGETNIKMLEVSRAPAFLGEKDVVKALQMQTGVTSVSEANGGFNVRGGGVDQNLVLYDGTPIFNASHAIGFFTAFNSEAINRVSFFKGGIPSEYGGRVSSVLDIDSKEGDYKKWKGSLGVGLVSGNLVVGGPIKRDTSALNLSFRSSYSDWILSLVKRYSNDVEKNSVGFHDGSLKYSTKLNDGAKLIFSTYFSRDRFQLANDSINNWSSLALSLKYGKQFRNEYYYSVGFNIGNYSYQISDHRPETAYSLKYKIFYPTLKFDVNRDGKRKQSFGVHVTLYNFEPGRLRPTSEQSNSKDVDMLNEISVETALYYGENFQVGSHLFVETGFRLSAYNRFGSGKVFLYQTNSPRELRSVKDSVQYSAGEIMKTYIGPEPRLSLRYIIGDRSSVKLGYNRMYQYVHLVSNTAVVTPVDIWQSSNTYFKPQIADQLSLGYFLNSKTNTLTSFVEVFYKHTQNVLDFKDGANLILNSKLETALLTGKGFSYGVEFSISKNRGRLETELNYTYSRTFRQVQSIHPTEEINKGERYPANYDQPHILNLNWRYSITRNVFFSGVFTYRTGRPISVPIAAYEINGVPVIDFSNRNNYRLSDYHRLDVALVAEGNMRKSKRIQGFWTLSVYNLYGRKNPYSAFFSYNVSGAVLPKQIALIGIPVPSLSYTLKF